MNARKSRVLGMVIVLVSGTYSSIVNVGALIFPGLAKLEDVSISLSLVLIISISLAIGISSVVTGLYMFGNDKTSIRVGRLHLLALYGIPMTFIGINGVRLSGTTLMILSGLPMVIFGVLLVSSDILNMVKIKDEEKKAQ
ncbi:MAG: hypothetical protein ACE5KG_00740 [Nitrososphaerales archaeon]